MWRLRILGVFSVTLTLVCSLTPETTSIRSPITTTTFLLHTKPQKVNKQSTHGNSSELDVLDVRTPPKVQSQIKDKLSSKYTIEPSHAGVAIPIIQDEVLEESTKKMNFYKLERPTTANGGLSTWILLSGKISSTSPKTITKKPSVKPIIIKDEKNNETLMLSDKPMKIAKPAFKQRSTTPRNPTKATTAKVNTFTPSLKNNSRKPITKLTKIKTSLVQNIISNLTTTTSASSEVTATITTTEAASTLPVEAKEGDHDLSANSDDKKKKTQKKKKNKNRRRKPGKSSKEGNNKLKEAESPGTQLYSYLRSEIIPVTVGVSLVGLLVTAGLAGYYLQPFAALRRNDPVERKDEGNYYYHDSYSNAMPEEEAIGKVIAGMPENALQETTNYQQTTSRKPFTQNVRYRQIDRRSQIYMNPFGSVEDVKLHDRPTTSYDSTNDKKFVVGGAPKEAIPEATPASIPEHGPRNFKEDDRKFVVGNIPSEFLSHGASPRKLNIRKRRDTLPNDLENEISSDENEFSSQSYTTAKIEITTNIEEATTAATNTEAITTEEVPAKETTPHNIYNPNYRSSTFLELLGDLFRLKIKLGLELIQNITSSVSTYVSKVHSRLDQHYRKPSRVNNNKINSKIN
ncbi:hypothetical protein ABEB36_014808 [Hypothenemus hampei]|uniref:Uncharacterized protein n=1 Tax=Hypothenemus hampei TaxID=57062 RepID=A0ABD1E0X3_HYPHA